MRPEIPGHSHYWGEKPEIHGFRSEYGKQYRAFKNLARFLKENPDYYVIQTSWTATQDDDAAELLVTFGS